LEIPTLLLCSSFLQHCLILGETLSRGASSTRCGHAQRIRRPTASSSTDLTSSFPGYVVAPGIFTHSPKQAPGALFRVSIDMGETSMSSTDVRREVQALGEHFAGTSYHIVLKNCNHFSREFVLRLTGQAIPSWVNRLANMGSLVSCLLPKGMGVHHPESSDVQSQSTLDRYRYSSLAAKSIGSTRWIRPCP
jgi:hypothetical protein